MKRIAIALLFAVVALAAAAQQFDLSIDNIMRGPGLYGWTPEDVRWSPDGQHVYFSWKLYTDTLEHDIAIGPAKSRPDGIQVLDLDNDARERAAAIG